MSQQTESLRAFIKAILNQLEPLYDLYQEILMQIFDGTADDEQRHLLPGRVIRRIPALQMATCPTEILEEVTVQGSISLAETPGEDEMSTQNKGKCGCGEKHWCLWGYPLGGRTRMSVYHRLLVKDDIPGNAAHCAFFATPRPRRRHSLVTGYRLCGRRSSTTRRDIGGQGGTEEVGFFVP